MAALPASPVQTGGSDYGVPHRLTSFTGGCDCCGDGSVEGSRVAQGAAAGTINEGDVSVHPSAVAGANLALGKNLRAISSPADFAGLHQASLGSRGTAPGKSGAHRARPGRTRSPRALAPLLFALFRPRQR